MNDPRVGRRTDKPTEAVCVPADGESLAERVPSKMAWNDYYRNHGGRRALDLVLTQLAMPAFRDTSSLSLSWAFASRVTQGDPAQSHLLASQRPGDEQRYALTYKISCAETTVKMPPYSYATTQSRQRSPRVPAALVLF